MKTIGLMLVLMLLLSGCNWFESSSSREMKQATARETLAKAQAIETDTAVKAKAAGQPAPQPVTAGVSKADVQAMIDQKAEALKAAQPASPPTEATIKVATDPKK